MHRLHLTGGLTGGLRLQAPRGPTQTPVVTAWSEKAVRVQLLSGQPMPRAGRPWQSCPGSLPAGQQQTNLTSPTCLTGTQPHGGREADERVCHIGQNSFCLCTMQKLSMCMCVHVCVQWPGLGRCHPAPAAVCTPTWHCRFWLALPGLHSNTRVPASWNPSGTLGNPSLPLWP